MLRIKPLHTQIGGTLHSLSVTPLPTSDNSTCVPFQLTDSSAKPLGFRTLYVQPVASQANDLSYSWLCVFIWKDIIPPTDWVVLRITRVNTLRGLRLMPGTYITQGFDQRPSSRERRQWRHVVKSWPNHHAQRMRPKASHVKEWALGGMHHSGIWEHGF